MYRILIKHNNDKKNNLWQSYGTYSNTTTFASTFTEFGTEDLEVLKAELVKLYGEYGSSSIKVVEEVEVSYDIEITTDETEETPTTPDDTTGDSTDDGDDTTITP